MRKGSALFILVFLTVAATAQLSNKLKDGLKFYIDAADSSRFIKLNMTNQLWLRYNQNNPNTAIIPGQNRTQENTTDISIRRIRMVLSGQLTDRVSFFVQFGQNSFNYLSARKAGAFFHDVTADYAVIKKYFSVGLGLNGWNGPSRFSNISVASIMVLDPPNYQEVTNDTYDQFVRRLGAYAKGKIGKLDYRLSAGKPFVITTASGGGLDPLNTNSSFSTLPPNMVYQGYFMYQFLDQESNFGPSNAGTYLGAKRIFNIGAGFYYQKNAMFRLSAPGDTSYQNIMLYAVDVMYDAPINKEKGNAVSIYGCYSNYNYGSGFLKVYGANNPGGASTNNSSLFNKANYGNAFPYLGTGNIFYTQAGYKFKSNLLKSQGTLQLYGDCQYSKYTRLKDGMVVFDAGINWLIRGQNAKFTLNCQNRPYFAADAGGALKQQSRKNSIVLQYQLAF